VADVEEDKPEPDLDELLELFREPEEEPRRPGIPGSVWMMLALILCMGGVWLALRVASGAVAAHAAAAPMKPGKASERKPLGETDVVEDYTTRCQKGMTARQVRWIVEDFQKEGLDDGPGSFRAIIEMILEPLDIAGADEQELEELSIDDETAAKLKTLGFEMAFRQQRWYADALADGLRLSSQQKLELKASGRRLVKDCEDDFLEINGAVAEAETEEPETEAEEPEASYISGRVLDGLSGTDLLFPRTGLLEPSYWLKQPTSAASERIDLTPGQLEIVHPEKGSAVEIPDRLGDVEEVLPLIAGQKFPADENDILGLAEAMHPAQLKVLLLLEPEIAGELMAALEESKE